MSSLDSLHVSSKNSWTSPERICELFSRRCPRLHWALLQDAPASEDREGQREKEITILLTDMEKTISVTQQRFQPNKYCTDKNLTITIKSEFVKKKKNK